jgi:hypothetical protein
VSTTFSCALTPAQKRNTVHKQRSSKRKRIPRLMKYSNHNTCLLLLLPTYPHCWGGAEIYMWWTKRKCSVRQNYHVATALSYACAIVQTMIWIFSRCITGAVTHICSSS